jgi:hypothetical protein
MPLTNMQEPLTDHDMTRGYQQVQESLTALRDRWAKCAQDADSIDEDVAALRNLIHQMCEIGYDQARIKAAEDTLYALRILAAKSRVAGDYAPGVVAAAEVAIQACQTATH